MPLNRRTTQQQICLIIIIPKPPQILNTPQRRLPIRHRRIQIMLLPILINAEALKRQIPARSIVGLHWPWEEKRGFHAQVRHAVLHDVELDRDDAGHFDGAAEADLAVSLGEVQVANAEFSALDVHGEVDLAATAKVLDVAVSAMLRAAGYGARAFLADLVFYAAGAAAGVHVLGLGRLGDDFMEILRGVGADELAFTTVPLGEDFSGGSAAEDAGVDEAGEADMGDMAGGGKNAFEVPDGFGAVRGQACQQMFRKLYLGRITGKHHARELYGLVRTYALGYISSKKPPPLLLSKTPVKPHGCSWNGCTSCISTIRISPGSAVSISKGPVK